MMTIKQWMLGLVFALGVSHGRNTYECKTRIFRNNHLSGAIFDTCAIQIDDVHDKVRDVKREEKDAPRQEWGQNNAPRISPSLQITHTTPSSVFTDIKRNNI